jgi:uncharacterized protein
MANRLAQETSPYLLQHQDNPVDWYPWGPEALERARKEDKPILLSVGYSACHWCHVMAHESFESPEIAKLMNESFVNIKVDREERPDLDQIYQNVAQAMTRSGGWPLTVFLTPDLKPFFGGTYFPPDDRYGRPGFPRVLEALAQAYRGERAAVEENAEKLTKFIGSLETLVKPPEGGRPAPSAELLRDAGAELVSAVDFSEGGFGGAPKFPNPMSFFFLWRIRDSVAQASDAVLVTLEKMASGGIFDQLGGGFHRYSVDDHWAVPHFEKMLYDNGLLLKLYAEVLLTGELDPEARALFTRVLEMTIEYLETELRSEEGGFYAAQDADSEGEEGKYFVWDPAELKAILGEQTARLFSARHGVTEAGNFEHAKTVLFLAEPLAAAARAAGMDESEARLALSSARGKLLSVRSRRVPPQKDTKVLTAWNGLAVSGLAWAARALEKEGSSSAAAARRLAVQAFEHVASQASAPDGSLHASIQEGKAKLSGYLDDYAFMAMAALDVARFATQGENVSGYLARAAGWTRYVISHFKGGLAGEGYFFTADGHEALIKRPKTVFDQAIPSGTAVMLQVLGALAEADPQGAGAEFERELEEQLSGCFHLAMRSPHGSSELLSAALQWLVGPAVVSGKGAGEYLASPWVYQRPAEAGAPAELLVCRRHACTKAPALAAELEASLRPTV